MDSTSTVDTLDDHEVLSDVNSCLNFLQQREVFLFKMMHDPFHKVMLYFLEHLLSQDNGAVMSMDEVLVHLNKECFTIDMKEACGGGDREALIQFFLRHPSLFSVSEDYKYVSAVQVDFSEISAATQKATRESLSGGLSDTEVNKKESIEKRGARAGFSLDDSASSTGSLGGSQRIPKSSTRAVENSVTNIQMATGNSPLPARKKAASFNLKNPMQNLEKESEAVKFFQLRLLKKEERWVPIKSVAGHLSQATESIREVVGPQSEFKTFLLRHPHVFDVQGELVALKNTFTAACIHGTNKPYSPWIATGTNISGTPTPSLRSSAGTNRGYKMRPKSLLISTPGTIISSTEAFTGMEKKKSVGSTGPGGPITTPLLMTDVSTNLSHTTGTRLAGAGAMDTGGGRHGNSFMAPSCSAPSTPTTTLYNPPNGNGATVNLCGHPHRTLTMTANDYNAVMFLRRLLEMNQQSAGLRACLHQAATSSGRSQGDTNSAKGLRGSQQADGNSTMPVTELLTQLSQLGNASVRNTIGWTKIELEEFLRKNEAFFTMRNGYVACKKPGTMSIIITGSRPVQDASRMLNNRSGRVFHVAKLWGIIDLGRHEHVFFDKSIFRHVDDLQKHFKVNELLYFNAVLAPKESRAKWRAVQVWKESDRALMERQWSAKSATPGENSTSKASKDSDISQRSSAQTRNRPDPLLPFDYGPVQRNKTNIQQRKDIVKPIESGKGVYAPMRNSRSGDIQKQQTAAVDSALSSMHSTTPSASTSSGILSDDLVLDKTTYGMPVWSLPSSAGGASGRYHHHIVHFTSEDEDDFPSVSYDDKMLEMADFSEVDPHDDVLGGHLYDDDDERSCCSYLHDLAHDIKFISEEVEEELAQVLQLQRRFSPEDPFENVTKGGEAKLFRKGQKERDPDVPAESVGNVPCHWRPEPVAHTLTSNNSNSQDKTTMGNDGATPLLISTSTLPQLQNGPDLLTLKPSTRSTTQKDMSTQTLVTGDIMATQVFHEGMSHLV